MEKDKTDKTNDDRNPGDLTAGEGLIASLKELRDSLNSGEPLEKRYTMRTVDLSLEIHEFSAEDVRKLRESFRASQAIFAKLLGASVKTVQSWEQGVAVPPMACRLLDLMQENPDRWRSILEDAVKPDS